MKPTIKITECPRDAIQGIVDFIPTKDKIEYINRLLKVGFDVIDVGSFVSPHKVPQMKDTDEVISSLNLDGNNSKLSVIIANLRGANKACSFQQISYLGFPLSISEEFQKRNTNMDINSAMELVQEIQNKTIQNNKKLIVYLSMAFGNPYGEHWHPDLVCSIVEKLNQIGVEKVSLSDTIGVSCPENISPLFKLAIKEFSKIDFAAHFHSSVKDAKEKIDAAFLSGCINFDSAIGGFGGCPMAKDDLVGNIPTELLVDYFKFNDVDLRIDYSALDNIVNNIPKYFK